MSDVIGIARILGGTKVLGRELRSTSDLVEAIQQGLPYESLETIAARVGLTTVEESPSGLCSAALMKDT